MSHSPGIPAVVDSHDTSTGEERSLQAVGTILLVAFLLLATLLVVERTAGLPFPMPRSWYTNRTLWYAMTVGSLIGGGWLLGRRSGTTWEPSVPGRRFASVVLYTRTDCPLCDTAHAILERYREWLPPIETVDVDSDPQLVERHGNWVPAVEIDGVLRFTGRVEEFALRRLIEGTPPA